MVSESFATPWTVVHQFHLSMGFSKQEYWSGLPFPPPGDLPNPGIKPESSVAPALQADFFTTEPLWKPPWFTDQGLNLGLLYWELGVLAIGPPGKSLGIYLALLHVCVTRPSYAPQQIYMASTYAHPFCYL